MIGQLDRSSVPFSWIVSDLASWCVNNDIHDKGRVIVAILNNYPSSEEWAANVASQVIEAVTNPARLEELQKNRPKLIESKYRGTCVKCKKPIQVGDPIFWQPSNGLIWHKEWESLLERRLVPIRRHRTHQAKSGFRSHGPWKHMDYYDPDFAIHK